MRHLIVVSNRLPVVITRAKGEYKIRQGAGGLVTAMKPLLAERGGAWVGFSGVYGDDDAPAWRQLLAGYESGGIHFHPVAPRRSVYRGYYLQYSNQELWPRFHSMTSKMRGAASAYWADYARLNELFAETAFQAGTGDSVFWIHDYHLMLLPRMLRQGLPQARLGFFLHIPFPPLEIMREQPHARQLLDGVLGADVAGFHVPAYMDNFIDAARHILGARVLERSETEAVLEHEGAETRLGAFPIGVDPEELERAGDVKRIRKRLEGLADTLILSMDRLDYTKAIPPRLEAYERLLESYPEYHGKVSLLQVLDVSRKDIPAYQEERETVERIVASIQERHPSWRTIYLSVERWNRAQVGGVMKMARIALVTPRCDGMNLVSKEYAAVGPEDGVLVLSRQAGAAWQFGRDAVLVDGNSPESIVEGLRAALEMPPDERRRRMAALRDNVRRESVFWWADHFLESIERQSATTT